MNRREAGQIARKLRESIGIGLEGMDCGAAFRDRPREAPDVGATVDGDVAGPQPFGRLKEVAHRALSGRSASEDASQLRPPALPPTASCRHFLVPFSC